MSTLPSRFRVAAAQPAARLVGSQAVARLSAEASFRRAATDGIYHAEDLSEGLDLLITLGLVSQQVDVLHPSAACAEFALLDLDEAVALTVQQLLERDPPP